MDRHSSPAAENDTMGSQGSPGRTGARGRKRGGGLWLLMDVNKLIPGGLIICSPLALWPSFSEVGSILMLRPSMVLNRWAANPMTHWQLVESESSSRQHGLQEPITEKNHDYSLRCEIVGLL